MEELLAPCAPPNETDPLGVILFGQADGQHARRISGKCLVVIAASDHLLPLLADLVALQLASIGPASAGAWSGRRGLQGADGQGQASNHGASGGAANTERRFSRRP